MLYKKLRIGIYEYVMLLLVVLALILRVILVSQHWPVTNSDEAIMDLMALHINSLGEHPVFFYGQAYMGPVEAYIGALCFRLFGESVFALRLGLVPFFALFLVSMYFLARKLYGKRLALFTVALLCVGSSDMFIRQLKAIGGYPEIPFFGAFIFFLCCKLALSSSDLYTQRYEGQKGQRWSRWLLYGLLGLLVGLAVWIDQLVAPYVATGLLLLLVFCWRDVFSRYGLVFLLGFVIGVMPLVSYDITAPLDQNFVLVLLKMHNAGQQALLGQSLPFLRQLSGTFLISLPTTTGFNPVCAVDQFPPFGTTTSTSWSCVAAQGGWSLGYLLLWLWAFLMASIGLWKLRGRPGGGRSMLPGLTGEWVEIRQQKIVYMARLLLLMSAVFTLLQYLGSPASGLTPNTSARYLECMLISTPALLWPLWSRIGRYRVGRSFGLVRLGGEASNTGGASSPLRHGMIWSNVSSVIALGCVCLLVFIGGMFLAGTVRIVLDVPNAQNEYNREEAVVQMLLNTGATRFYSEYWTCNHLIFRSNERLICSNLNGALKADVTLDRYQPYHDSVRESRVTVYVFGQGTSQQRAMDAYLRSRRVHYTRREFKGYIIYQMASPIGIP